MEGVAGDPIEDRLAGERELRQPADDWDQLTGLEQMRRDLNEALGLACARYACDETNDSLRFTPSFDHCHADAVKRGIRVISSCVRDFTNIMATKYLLGELDD